jgi:hypothetical protein
MRHAVAHNVSFMAHDQHHANSVHIFAEGTSYKSTSPDKNQR